ncbi:MAG: di-trans,poly-cis-decaprenylcistransferase [Christensenellaceae bacterium]|nr:di-trans,poly-cis-decaprenylcistransferase [Christensenellaceae bacterium]
MRLIKHLAVIMDGNGRWAEERGLDRKYGHIRGALATLKIITAADSLDINYLTLYAFSTENFSRPPSEVSFILEIICDHITEKILPLALENDYRLNFLGDFSLLPSNVASVCKSILTQTSKNAGMVISIAIGYGGRSEIVNAVNKYIAKLKSENSYLPITYDELSSFLYTFDLPDPELVIRYGGHSRLSNFMPLQTAYSDFIFTDKLWPDFVSGDLSNFLHEYSLITKKYGNISK